MTPPRTASSTWRRLWRGCLSFVGAFVYPLGKYLTVGLGRLASEQRYQRGLVVILPGIEGKSYLNTSLAFGLADGGVELAIEIDDWTTGWFPLFLYHLRGLRRNRSQAQRIAQRIIDYQSSHPGRPVYLIGHSGGGALAIFTLEQLPAENAISAAILLAPAISPQYDIQPALERTQQGVWNFSSWFDWFFLIAGTSLFGTVDGRHCPSAGATGFRPGKPTTVEADSGRRLHERPFSAKMLAQFHLGGHFGCTNRVFVADEIAPLLANDDQA